MLLCLICQCHISCVLVSAPFLLSNCLRIIIKIYLLHCTVFAVDVAGLLYVFLAYCRYRLNDVDKAFLLLTFFLAMTNEFTILLHYLKTPMMMHLFVIISYNKWNFFRWVQSLSNSQAHTGGRYTWDKTNCRKHQDSKQCRSLLQHLPAYIFCCNSSVCFLDRVWFVLYAMRVE